MNRILVRINEVRNAGALRIIAINSVEILIIFSLTISKPKRRNKNETMKNIPDAVIIFAAIMIIYANLTNISLSTLKEPLKTYIIVKFNSNKSM